MLVDANTSSFFYQRGGDPGARFWWWVFRFEAGRHQRFVGSRGRADLAAKSLPRCYIFSPAMLRKRHLELAEEMKPAGLRASVRAMRLRESRLAGAKPSCLPKVRFETGLARVSAAFRRRVPGGIKRKQTGLILKPDLTSNLAALGGAHIVVVRCKSSSLAVISDPSRAAR